MHEETIRSGIESRFSCPADGEVVVRDTCSWAALSPIEEDFLVVADIGGTTAQVLIGEIFPLPCRGGRSRQLPPELDICVASILVIFNAERMIPGGQGALGGEDRALGVSPLVDDKLVVEVNTHAIIASSAKSVSAGSEV